jgi:CRP/FNR family transcriptional regulator, anaerobic regulatory protein
MNQELFLSQLLLYKAQGVDMPISSAQKLKIKPTQYAAASSFNEQKLNQKQSPCLHCATYRVCPAASLADELPNTHFEKAFNTHTLGTGEHICHAGQVIQAVYVVKSGMFKTYLVTECGDERVINFYLPGEVIGVDALADGKHLVAAMAIEMSTICAIPIIEFERQPKDLSSNWLIKQACMEILRERQSFLDSSRKHSADAKMALFLLNLSERHRTLGYSFRSFKLNMPRRDLANHLDLALETVSRVISRFQDANIIDLDRRLVTIIDFDYLRMVACIGPKHNILHCS